jgi:hypothetical protein
MHRIEQLIYSKPISPPPEKYNTSFYKNVNKTAKVFTDVSIIHGENLPIKSV